MRARAAWLALVVACAPARGAPDGDAARLEAAKAAEQRAFDAIDASRWCEAMHAFVEANALAPSTDLVRNAAQAADLAGDRERALKLWADVLAGTSSKGRREVRRTIDALARKIEKDGPGTPCPPPQPPAATPTPTPTTDDAPKAAPAGEDQASTGAADAPQPAARPQAPSSTPLAWATAGTGAAVVLAGLGAASIGALPWLGHGDAVRRILAAEASGGDARALQDEQAKHRADWEGWGRPAVVVGGALAGAGAVALVVGAAWAALAATPQEEP